MTPFVPLLLPALFGARPRALHCLGVGGMGLGPLAIYAAELGFSVSGSDDAMTDAMRVWLERSGVVLTAADTIPEAAELVVASSAIPSSHPALEVAARRGLPVVRRGELLAELARQRRLVAVCGSHGKTTTTAMLVTVLRDAGLAPGYVGGGLFADDTTPPAAAGSGDLLVAEIDESDGTIDRFAPFLTVLVNLDWDHPDYYRTQADLENAFASLLRRATGPALINAECALSARAAAAAGLAPGCFTFGRSGDYALSSSVAAGLRPRVPAEGCLRVVFQPHRFSRTARFRAAFADSLAAADALYLLDVYGAGESPLTGGSTTDLADTVRAAAPGLPLVHLAGDHTAVFQRLGADLCPGDFVAIVGAGDLDVSARAWLSGFNWKGWWDRVAAELQTRVSPGTCIQREVSLADKTTLRVGGAARLYAEPVNDSDLVDLVRAAHSLSLRVLPLGRGSNLLVPDEGVDALVISLRHSFWQRFEPLPDGCVRAGAGLRLKNLCGLAANAGLVGFEFLEGIPGNLGGSLRMNAGAMGGWMFDVVETVDFVTLAGERRTLPKSAMHVDYRHCAELESAIALGAVLRPPAAGAKSSFEINQQIDAYRDKRRKSQPREPSAGCIFKNPQGDSAGRLIDTAGLKGSRMGDAEVSPVHANFIVNHDHARAADVIALVRRVRAEVEQKHGVRLEPEVLLYGRDWKEFL